MYRLQLLGTAALTAEGGDPVPRAAVQPLRLAVLAVLGASADRGVSRDRLSALFWPDVGDREARQYVSDVVYRLRQALGGGAVRSEGDRLVLDAHRIRSDVVEFEARLDQEGPERAVRIYGGPFLDGFHLRGCSRAFEEWVDEQRSRLSSRYCGALESLATDPGLADVMERVRRWKRLTEVDPFQTRYAVGLVYALAEAGDPAGALRQATRHADLLDRELGLVPPASLEAAVAAVEAGGQVPAAAADGWPRSVAHDSRSEVQAAATGRGAWTPTGDPQGPRGVPDPLDDGQARRRERGARVAPFVIATALMAAAWLARPARKPTSAPVWLPSPFLDDQAPTGQTKLTPDGAAAVYSGPGPGDADKQLWYRRFDAAEAHPIPGTAFSGGATFAISPDGRKVAFVPFLNEPHALPIRIASLEGTSTRSLSVRAMGVAAWSREGIYFHGPGTRVLRVDPGSGALDTITSTSGVEYHLSYVPIAAGARGIVEVRPGGAPRATSSELWALDLASGERRRLVSGHSPRVVASGRLLLFVTGEGILMAAPLDERDGTLTGEPRVALDAPLALEPVFGSAFYDVSESGTLVFMTGSDQAGRYEFGWMDRRGAFTRLVSGIAFEPGVSVARGWKLSPDHRLLAFQATTRGNTDIHLLSLATGLTSRLTFDPGYDGRPRWSHDGSTLWFLSRRGGRDGGSPHVWSVSSDGVGEPSPMFPDLIGAVEAQSPDGEWLVLELPGRDGRDSDIVALRPSLDSVPVLRVPGDGSYEESPVLSPDGRWLAYTSNESGRGEVYVRPFPNISDARWQVSADGGEEPIWGALASELFYYERRTRSLVSVRYTAGPSFELVDRRVLFQVPADFMTFGDFYDVSGDDQRFLMARIRPDAFSDATTRTDLKQNFVDELRRLWPEP